MSIKIIITGKWMQNQIKILKTDEFTYNMYLVSMIYIILNNMMIIYYIILYPPCIHSAWCMNICEVQSSWCTYCAPKPGACFNKDDGLADRTTDHRPMLFLHSRMVRRPVRRQTVPCGYWSSPLDFVYMGSPSLCWQMSFPFNRLLFQPVPKIKQVEML